MGLLEFNKLPINTLVGADWKTFKDITGGRDIGAAYKGSEVSGAVNQAVGEALTYYLEEHPKEAKQIVDKVILAATARRKDRHTA